MVYRSLSPGCAIFPRTPLRRGRIKGTCELFESFNFNDSPNSPIHPIRPLFINPGPEPGPGYIRY